MRAAGKLPLIVGHMREETIDTFGHADGIVIRIIAKPVVLLDDGSHFGVTCDEG